MPNCQPYQLNLPYPPLRVNQPDMALAYALLGIYAGPLSEWQAVLQYVYQSIFLHDLNHEVSEALLCLAINEMHHLEQLGVLIHQLGVDPRYASPKDGRLLYANAGYVNYTNDLQGILRADLSNEQMAISDYRQILTTTRDPYVRAVIERIIKDEQHHQQVLSGFINKFQVSNK